MNKLYRLKGCVTTAASADPDYIRSLKSIYSSTNLLSQFHFSYLPSSSPPLTKLFPNFCTKSFCILLHDFPFFFYTRSIFLHKSSFLFQHRSFKSLFLKDSSISTHFHPAFQRWTHLPLWSVRSWRSVCEALCVICLRPWKTLLLYSRSSNTHGEEQTGGQAINRSIQNAAAAAETQLIHPPVPSLLITLHFLLLARLLPLQDVNTTFAQHVPQSLAW